MLKTCVVYRDEQPWSLLTADNDEMISFNLNLLTQTSSYLILDKAINRLEDAPAYDESKVTKIIK